MKKPVVYDGDIPKYADVMTVEHFKENVADGGFIDDDGIGHPVRDKKQDMWTNVLPSDIENIPSDATHIAWYNR